MHQGKSNIPYQSSVFVIPTLSSFPREGNGNKGVEAPIIFHSFQWMRKLLINSVKRLRETHQQFWVYGISCGSSLPHLLCVTSFHFCGPYRHTYVSSVYVCVHSKDMSHAFFFFFNLFLSNQSMDKLQILVYMHKWQFD